MSLYRIVNLVLLQLGNKLNIKKKGLGQSLLTIALMLAAIVGITFVYSLLFSVVRSFFYLNVTRNILFFIIVLLGALSIIALSISMSTSLYGSKDNPILLSFPSKHTEVFYSKLIVLYIGEFVRNLYTVFPLMIAFGIYGNEGIYYYIMTVLMSLIIPLITVLVSSLLSIPLMYIKKIFKKVPIISIVFWIGIIGGVLILLTKFVSGLPHPLRLKAIYNSLAINIDKAVSVITNNSLWYIWIADIMFNKNVLLSALFLLLLIGGTFVLNILLSKPLFFTLASQSNEQARFKNHSEKTKVTKNTYLAFLKKELIITFRNLGRLVEEYSLVLTLPFILYLLNGFFNSLSLNSLGVLFSFGINCIIGLLFVTASNQDAASSLSKEGGEFVLLKIAPSKTYLICWAKVTMNALLTTLFVIISLVVVGLFNVINPVMLIELGILIIVINISHILWSLQLDIKNPLMREYASTGGVSDNKNVSKSISNGIILSIAFGALIMLLYIMMNTNSNVLLITKFSGVSELKESIDATIKPFLISLGLAFVWLGLRFYFFSLNLKCLFNDMEY